MSNTAAARALFQQVPPSFLCPILMDVMVDPVILVATGQTFDRSAIEQWLTTRDTCPATNVRLRGNKQLVSNLALRNSIEEFAAATENILRSLDHQIPYTDTDLQIERLFVSARTKDIYKGTWLGKPVAICVIKGPSAEIGAREATILSSLGKHPHLVRFFGRSVNERQQAVLVLEWAPDGRNLHTLISDKFDDSADGRSGILSERVMLTILSQIAEGMQALIENDVIHKDLSARNILVFAFDETLPVNSIRVKVSDLGMSSLLGQSLSYYYGEGGVELPVRWMAPESLTRNKWSEKTDVFSFGVLIWEMLSGGEVPWGLGTSNDRIQERVVVGGERLPCKPQWPARLVQIMTRCWAANPSQRPTFNVIRDLLLDAVAACSSAVVLTPPSATTPAVLLREVVVQVEEVKTTINTIARVSSFINLICDCCNIILFRDSSSHLFRRFLLLQLE